MKYRQVKLGELGRIITGNTPSKKKKEYYDSEHIAFIKPNNFNTDKITELSESNESLSILGSKAGRIVPKGTVLVTCIGTIGNIGIANKDICFNQQINAIEPNLEIVDNRYLAYSIMQRKRQLKAIANAPVVPIINKAQFSAFKIPLPPLQTQKKIAEVLDKAQELIDLRKKQIELLDELIQSVFYDMFGDPVMNPKGWEAKKLEQLGVWKSGGTPARKVKEYYQGDIPWVSSGELNTPFVNDSFEHITIDAVTNSSAKIMPKGSIMLGMYDTAALKSSITTTEMTCNQAIAFSKLDDAKSNTLFVYWCIQIGKEHYRRMQRGVRQKNMNLSMIKSMELISPEIKLQNEFAKKVQKIENQKQLMQQSLTEMENNFNSLMQRAFKGELFNQ